jgi:hypothetical protein
MNFVPQRLKERYKYRPYKISHLYLAHMIQDTDSETTWQRNVARHLSTAEGRFYTFLRREQKEGLKYR